MARGTFANIRLKNKMLKGKEGPHTIHYPSQEVLSIFDAAERYKSENRQLVIFGGKEYGSGSSRDWAAKGPYLLGVKAVIAESFERIHRSNLVGMGILPLTFINGESASVHGIEGNETVTISLDPSNLIANEDVTIELSSGKKFTVRSNLKTDVELTYFRNGGVLPFVLR